MLRREKSAQTQCGGHGITDQGPLEKFIFCAKFLPGL
jgi:hypothetical protein